MADLKRLLNSVGKSNFVDFFEDYEELYLSKENLTKSDKTPLARKLLLLNPNANEESGQFTRINAALRIFEHGLEHAALNEILDSKPNKIPQTTIIKAQNLLKNSLLSL